MTKWLARVAIDDAMQQSWKELNKQLNVWTDHIAYLKSYQQEKSQYIISQKNRNWHLTKE